MSRIVRDYLEVRDVTSLDQLINQLSAIRDGLPNVAETEVRLRGDDHFGRHIAIAYNRPLTVEEAELDTRYADAGANMGALRAAA